MDNKHPDIFGKPTPRPVVKPTISRLVIDIIKRIIKVF